MGLVENLRSLDPEARASLVERIERFDAGQINDAGITMLMQDLIYVQGFQYLPEKFSVALVHYAEQGLVTVPGMYVH